MVRPSRYRLPGIAALALIALFAAITLLPARSRAQTGQYLSFIGPHSGWLEVPDDPGLSPTSAITVEAWIYLDSYTGFGGNQTDCPIIVGKNWQTSYALSLACGGDVMQSFINGEEKTSENTHIPLQTWTHLAMTYDGTTRRHYVNGELVTEVGDPLGPIVDGTDELRIGNDVNWNFSPDGRIDDVRIWNVARSGDDIAATMESVNPGMPGLVAEWQFENGSSTDLIGGRNGVLNGNIGIDGPTPTPSPTPSPSPSPSPLPGVSVPPNTPGDYDCDGSIAMIDAARMLGDIAGAPLIPEGRPCSVPTGEVPVDSRDANCDGVFDIQDPLFVLKVVAQIASPAACPTPTPPTSQTPAAD